MHHDYSRTLWYFPRMTASALSFSRLCGSEVRRVEEGACTEASPWRAHAHLSLTWNNSSSGPGASSSYVQSKAFPLTPSSDTVGTVRSYRGCAATSKSIMGSSCWSGFHHSLFPPHVTFFILALRCRDALHSNLHSTE